MKDSHLLYIELALLILLFYFAHYSKIFNNLILSAFFTVGIVGLLWSVYNMGIRYFSPFPQPPKKHQLTQKGLYQYMLHPMYTSLMLIGLILVASNASFQNFFIYLILIYVLDMKASIEERLLEKMYPEYKAYKQKTKKFIPYLY
ncbi:hypothetical protein A2164_03680 [Candidatus Curtissbacteria bacterium RBG_13_35_7]|uniref:Steroid 5-alpha reductase C-terminal domain-containing protein n=1 Tax=Candidatus Curtissbacteria bacterium RBG_13_35_7 TaxID=1797705 RepID=A0A1F5G3P8_9BACT|nr:MAG: hypothetical protein A2164_03680 [Candidatus Curtissbacteria bacterium RBG_13_35_7]